MLQCSYNTSKNASASYWERERERIQDVPVQVGHVQNDLIYEIN